MFKVILERERDLMEEGGFGVDESFVLRIFMRFGIVFCLIILCVVEFWYYFFYFDLIVFRYLVYF